MVAVNIVITFKIYILQIFRQITAVLGLQGNEYVIFGSLYQYAGNPEIIIFKALGNITDLGAHDAQIVAHLGHIHFHVIKEKLG